MKPLILRILTLLCALMLFMSGCSQETPSYDFTEEYVSAMEPYSLGWILEGNVPKTDWNKPLKIDCNGWKAMIMPKVTPNCSVNRTIPPRMR